MKLTPGENTFLDSLVAKSSPVSSEEDEFLNSLIAPEAKTNIRHQLPRAGGLTTHEIPHYDEDTEVPLPEHEARLYALEGERGSTLDFVPEILAGTALAPLFAPAIGAAGIGLASWKAAGFMGRVAYGAVTGAASVVGEYVLLPAAEKANEIHPYLGTLVYVAGAPLMALTVEAKLTNLTLKALTKTAPKFWTGQLKAFKMKGFIPDEYDDALAQMVKRGDVGDTKAIQELMDQISEINYTNLVTKQEEQAILKGLKEAKLRATVEPTTEVVASLSKKIATGGNLGTKDFARIVKTAQRDAIDEFAEEFSKFQRETINTRAVEEFSQHPSVDIINILKGDGGIPESAIAKMFKDSPDQAEIIIKAFKEHGLLAPVTGEAADILGLAKALEVSDLKIFMRSLAETPTLDRIRRSKVAALKGEFNTLRQEGLYAKIAEKQAEQLNKILGRPLAKDAPKLLRAKQRVARKAVGRISADIGLLKKTITRLSNRLLTETDTLTPEEAIKLHDQYSNAVEKLLVRTEAYKQVEVIKENLTRSLKNTFIYAPYKEQLQNFLQTIVGTPKNMKFRTLDETIGEFLARKGTEDIAPGTDLLLTKFNTMLDSLAQRQTAGFDTFSLNQLQDIDEFVTAFKHIAKSEKYLSKKNIKMFNDIIAANIAATTKTTAYTSRIFRPKEQMTTESFMAAQARKNKTKFEIDPEDILVEDFTKNVKGVAKPGMLSIALSDLKRIEFIARQMDGFEDLGLAWTHIFNRFNTAKALEEVLGDSLFNKYKVITKLHKHGGRYWKKRLPQIGTLKTTRTTAVAMALNSGNEDNMKALLRHLNGKQLRNTPHEVTEEMVQKYLKDHLTEGDWKFVEGIQKLLNEEIFPLLARTYKEVTGMTLQRRTGKYFPIAAEDFYNDMRRHEKLQDLYMSSPQKLRASLEKGMVMEQHDGVNRLDLSLDPITRHIRDSVHLVTHWKAIQDVHGLIKNPKLKEAVTNTMGRATYDEFEPWLRNLARPATFDPAQRGSQRAMRLVRSRGTIGALAWRITTGAKQSLSALTAIPEVGVTSMAAAGLKFLRNPFTFYRNISQASNEMYFRSRNWELIMTELHQSNLGRRQGLLGPVRDTFFFFIHTVDKATAGLVWQAAYIKGISDYGDPTRAVAIADSIVRRTQPASAAKDLPNFIRSGEGKRALGMFYSYFSVWHNQVAEIMNRGLSGNMSKTQMLTTLAWMAAAPVVAWEGVQYAGQKLAGREIDDEKWLAEMGERLAMSPFAGVPVVRDIANAVFMGYEFSVSPAEGVVRSVIGGVQAGSKAGKMGLAHSGLLPVAISEDWIWDEEWTRGDTLNAATAAAYIGKLPSMAIITGLEAALRVLEGETEDLTEFIHRPPRYVDEW